MRHYNQKEKRTAPLSARVPCRMQWLYVMQSCRCSLRVVCALWGRNSGSLSLLGIVCECYVICRVVEGNGTSMWEVMEWDILTHSSIGNCGSVWCDDREGCEVWMTRIERIDGESCVKERGKERHCWRAGVISRNEGEEGEALLVWMVFCHLKAHRS